MGTALMVMPFNSLNFLVNAKNHSDVSSKIILNVASSVNLKRSSLYSVERFPSDLKRIL